VPFVEIPLFLFTIPGTPHSGQEMPRPEWAVIKVDWQDQPYYAGIRITPIQSVAGPCLISTTPITTPYFAVMLTGQDVVVFASRRIEQLQPLQLLRFERRSLRSLQNSHDVTRIELE